MSASAQRHLLAPTTRLSASRFAELREMERDGERQLDAAYDQVVAELIEDNIVAKALGRGLKDWLKVVIPIYFDDRSSEAKAITIDQARSCQGKIAVLGDKLRAELARFYEMPDARYRWMEPRYHRAAEDLRVLEALLSRVLASSGVRKVGRKDNASKRSLQRLGDDICWFWMTGWTGRLDRSWQLEPPEVAVHSKYFKFAKYVYAFVSENLCSDRMIVERLRDTERRLAFLDPDFFTRYRAAAQAFLEKEAQDAALREARRGYRG